VVSASSLLEVSEISQLMHLVRLGRRTLGGLGLHCFDTLGSVQDVIGRDGGRAAYAAIQH
jgi:hypothetical protein